MSHLSDKINNQRLKITSNKHNYSMMIRSGKYEFLLQASTATNSARLAMYFILLFIYTCRSLHCICNFYEKQTVQSDATCTSILTCGINDYLYRIWTGIQVSNIILEL